MYPNLFKLSGELLPTVIHVASRASKINTIPVAGQALSIYGDHNDVMAVRSAGCAMICSASRILINNFLNSPRSYGLGSNFAHVHIQIISTIHPLF